MCKEYDDPDYGFEMDYDDEYVNDDEVSDNSLSQRKKEYPLIN